MKLCELLLPPIVTGETVFENVGDRVELTDGDAAMFAASGVVKILGKNAPEIDPEVTQPLDAEAPEVEPTAPAKPKAKR